mmetsp:Transcript_113051/g.200415  ORF Transcript_113051/g.200415 Transcript_113051/m.200415 type:complete len:296 (+) Transcript_113051:39-926(+)
MADLVALASSPLGACAAGICCCFCTWKVCIKQIIKKVVRKAVEKKAPAFLGGSSFQLKKFQFSIMPFSVSLDGLQIGNLEGFKSEYLVKINQIYVRLKLCGAITSKGKNISIPRIVISDLDCILEKDSLTTSNVSALLKKMDEDKKKADKKDQEAEVSYADQLSGAAMKSHEHAAAGVAAAGDHAANITDQGSKLLSSDKKEAPKEKGKGVTIDIIHLENISCRATTTIQVENNIHSAKVTIPNVDLKLGGGKVDPQSAVEKIISQISSKVLAAPALHEELAKFTDFDSWDCTLQ